MPKLNSHQHNNQFASVATSTSAGNSVVGNARPLDRTTNNNQTGANQNSKARNQSETHNTMECTSLNHLYIKKGYVQRDYSKGSKIRFETTLPNDLEGVISQAEFGQFVEALNEIYQDAEQLRFCEGCLACLTGYLLYCCIETHKQKCMRKAAEFITNQNELWKDRGITVFDPITRGFRILEVQAHTNVRS